MSYKDAFRGWTRLTSPSHRQDGSDMCGLSFDGATRTGAIHDGCPLKSIWMRYRGARSPAPAHASSAGRGTEAHARSEEHTSELQSLMRISYAVFCLKNKKNLHNKHNY